MFFPLVQQRKVKKMNLAMDIIQRDDVLTKFNVTKRTLQNWVHRGLPVYRVGRKVFYKVSELESFIVGGGRSSTTKRFGLK